MEVTPSIGLSSIAGSSFSVTFSFTPGVSNFTARLLSDARDALGLIVLGEPRSQHEIVFQQFGRVPPLEAQVYQQFSGIFGGGLDSEGA